MTTDMMFKPGAIQFYGSFDNEIRGYTPIDRETTDTSTLRYALNLINYDELYAQSPDAVIANSEDLLTSNISKEFVNRICQLNDGEIPFVPACECGEMKGLFFYGQKCNKCGTEVSSAFVNKLSHSVWISLPDHFPPFIHPVWYQVLNKSTGICNRTVKFMQMILDDTVPLPDYLQKHITGRGFKWFYDNHEAVFHMLFHEINWPKAKRRNIKILKYFYDKYKDCLFYRKIPVLHKELHPIINVDNSGRKVDKTSKNILDVIYDVAALTFSKRHNIVTRKSFNRSYLKIYDRILQYHRSIIEVKLGIKEAMIRRHNLGSRLHWSYRTVCIPISGVHKADELYMPWKLMVNAYKLQIINKLMKRGYDVNTSTNMILNALVNYSSLIYEILEELKRECPWKGFPVLIGRNPEYIGLYRGDSIGA